MKDMRPPAKAARTEARVQRALSLITGNLVLNCPCEEGAMTQPMTKDDLADRWLLERNGRMPETDEDYADLIKYLTTNEVLDVEAGRYEVQESDLLHDGLEIGRREVLAEERRRR